MEILRWVHSVIWGPWTAIWLAGAGCIFTVRMRAFQICGFPVWWKETIGSLRSERTQKGSQMGTVCTALAATVGTGNIAGVATALTAGGPGALFWIWVSALVGMITAYGETFLGLKYREGGLCGPFLYMEKGLGFLGLGRLYAGLCVLTAFGMGSMVQSNSAAETLEAASGIPAPLTGAVITLLLLAVVRGGVKHIGAVAQGLMPVASALYLAACLGILIAFRDRIPEAIGEIVRSALDPRAAAGGVGGYTFGQSLRYGISRGVFSNEAGLGTLAVLHGSAERAEPSYQGMWAMFEVFFDTIVMCSLTALVILVSVKGSLKEVPFQGAALVSRCFSQAYGSCGEWVTGGSMVLFAFGTMIAWYYLGRQAALYLGTGLAEKLYPVVFPAAVFSGALFRLEAVWLLSDLWNGLMALVNVTALLFLFSQVKPPVRTEKDVLPADSTSLSGKSIIKREES